MFLETSKYNNCLDKSRVANNIVNMAKCQVKSENDGHNKSSSFANLNSNSSSNCF